ncbi:thiamine pyrophosphate-binding protein [Caballeronia telluris]|uniref:Acetolactate synthase n=1 Tax=Caballeronia telluris TaxID=326475 RepID=A0A158J706_9BURK|nr:thiamine pyrophosphate-binding protein [Caballeronia telluris]SAL64616.1 acetolactate synthase [Caballeronia telluris]
MRKMRVAEYLASFLAEQHAGHVFMLTGGGAMFLNDALTHADGLTPVYCHHEQACAMAAEGYARVTNRPGVVNVTTGPGGINALNGVFGAYTDSIPMLVLSGQVKRDTHLATTPVDGLRQLGDQEVDIVSMARPVCKDALTLKDPQHARAVIERAWALCQHGRPGPVWIDIPIDVQSAQIDADALEAWDGQLPALAARLEGRALESAVKNLLGRVTGASRPLFLLGTGARLSGQHENIVRVAEALGVPLATAWTHDTVPSDHPLFAGRPGTIGTRQGNFVLQAADLLVVFGSRLNIRQTGYNFGSFAKNAVVVQIDIDEAESRKPTYSPDEAVIADLRDLVPLLLADAPAAAAPERFEAWRAWIAQTKKRYPALDARPRPWNGRINPYVFIDELFKLSRPGDVVATGNASACIIPFQIAPIKNTVRLFSNSGSASMGYDIPAAIGAAFAIPAGGRVWALAGDGSTQLNVQELQTIAHYKLPIKVVVLNNEGYLSIRSSQANFFKRLAGEGPESGVTFPNFADIGAAYRLPSVRIDRQNFREALREAIEAPGPMLIEVMLDPQQGFEPRVSSRQLPDGTIQSPQLEDMFPFLQAEELEVAMRYPGFDARDDTARAE